MINCLLLGSYEDYFEAVAARLAAEQCLGWLDCDLNSSALNVLKRYLNK